MLENQVQKPGVVKTVSVLLYVQAVLVLLGNLVVVGEVISRLDHNQEVDGLAWFTVVLNAVMLILLITCATQFHRRLRWVRALAAVAEGIALINSLINIALVGMAGVLGLAFGIVMLLLLFHKDTNRWLEAQE